MRPGHLILLVIALSGPAGAAGQKPLTTADLYQLRSVGDVQLSPDGKQVAYTVRKSDTPGRPYSEIWVAAVADGEPSLVGAGNGPRWSPDGSRIAYAGRDSETAGIFIVKVEGLRPKAESTGVELVAPTTGTNHPLPSAGEEIAWSPDGKQIAFISSTPGPEADANGDPMVITRYLYKPTASEGSTRFNDNRRTHIFVADAETKAVRQLTTGHFYEHSIDWSPRGDEIVFVSNRERDPDRVFNYDLFAVKVSDGTVRRLTDTKSAEYYPRWAPDGASIAFLATKRELTSSETTMEDTHVWVMKADGTGRREIGARIDNRQGAPKWVNDGVAFTVEERGVTSLYVDRSAVDVGGSVEAWSIAGGVIAAAVETRDHPAELITCGRRSSDRREPSACSPRRALTTNNAFLRDRAIAGVEAFRFKSFDGLEVEAFLTKPAAFDPARKYPLIVVIHGGPHGQQGPMFNARAQIYAGAGFASLMVNYRGSTGYGQKFTDAIFGDQNGGEAKDVLGGVSAAVARYPWIDRTALFVEGVSYGGQLTNWLITQTDRFKAAVPIAGIANLVSFNYMAYYHDYLAVEYGSYPHEKGLTDKLWERSPIRYARDVKTPTLFIHGENDNDVPIAESEQFYIALKDVGVETVMVRYPREGHGIRETSHLADAIERALAWYRAHLGRQARL